jgi:hypothetical protein
MGYVTAGYARQSAYEIPPEGPTFAEPIAIILAAASTAPQAR